MLNGVSPAPRIKSNHFGSNSIKGGRKPAAGGEKSQKTDQVEFDSKGALNSEVKLNTYVVDSLKRAANQSNENLRRMVETLVSKQGKTAQVLSVASRYKDGDVTAHDIGRAQLAISNKGEFGIEAVSDRLVNFAITLSGGDKEKYEELKDAVKNGFEAARATLGGYLPNICHDTYETTIKKLDAWVNEE